MINHWISTFSDRLCPTDSAEASEFWTLIGKKRAEVAANLDDLSTPSSTSACDSGDESAASGDESDGSDPEPLID
jgi:hypothetical protein